MLLLLELVFAILMFFALYKPMHYHITLDKKEFNPNFYDYEKAIVLYYYVKELKPTAFFAFFPKWVNSIYANGVPAYYKKYYPYTYIILRYNRKKSIK